MTSLAEILAKLDPPEVLFHSEEDAYDTATLSAAFSRVLSANPWKQLDDNAPVTVQFAIIDRDDPNAFVVEADSHIYLVAFHSGLLKSLMNVFARAAHHDVMFKEVESPGPSQHLPLLEPSPHASSDPNRMLLATLLYRLALEFLFYHELHHLILGHAGYVSKRTRLRLNESGKAALLDPLGQRPMEYAADFWAAKTLYDSILGRRFVTLTPKSLEGLDTHHLLYAAVLAFTTLFAALQYFDPQDVPTYPTMGARSLTFIHDWTRRIDNDKPIPPNLWGHASTTALHAVRVAFTECYGAVGLMDFTEDDDAIDRAYDEITELAGQATAMSRAWKDCAVRTERVRQPPSP
jgi:hypothetical protein